MSVQLDINDFRCYNQLTNGADFSLNTSDYATTLVGNVGELVRVKYNAVFQYGSNASIGNAWSVTAGKFVRSNGNFQTDDRLVIGDVFLFFSDFTNTVTEEFTGEITGFSEGGKALLFSVTAGTQVTTGVQSNVGFICDPSTTANNHTTLFLRFGLIPNNETYTNASLLTGSPMGFAANSLQVLAPVTASWEGSNLDSFSGQLTADIIDEGGGSRFTTYQVVHDFIIMPTYVAGQLANVQNNIAPAIFEGGASLKYAFSLELRKTKTDTATAKTLVYDSLIGAVGWLNENFNGGASVYSLVSCAFTDTATSASVTALQPYRKTTASISINGGATAGQLVGVYVQWLPSSISAYTNTTTDYLANFVADSAIAEEGAGDLIGTGVIKRVQANASGAIMMIDCDLECTVTQGDTVRDGYYLIAVSIQDPAISASDSDRTTLIASVAQYEAVGMISGLIDFTAFDMLVHNQVLGVDSGNIVATAWNEDGLLLDFAFDLDLAKDANLSQLVFRLVAYNTAEDTYFDLDSYTLDCTAFAVSGGVQQLEVDTTRGYALASGDQFNFVKLTTGARVGDLQGYTGSFGQKVAWQDWRANASADTVFFDSTKPNNNLNFKASNYSGLSDYEIKIICEATLTGVDDLGVAGNGFEVAQVEAITVYDYAVSDDGSFSAGEILTLDADSEEDLEGALYFDRNTLFRTVWTTADNSLSNVWAVHRLEISDANGYTEIQELSSIWLPPTQILTPIDGETLLYTYADGADIVTECYIDGTRLDTSKTYKLSARIERTSEAFNFFTVFNNATSAPFVASVVSSGTGAWVFGANVVAGNSLSTSSTYLDGSQRLVSYKATSFAGLTEIDVDDAQGRGVLDLSDSIFDNLTDLRAANNLFTEVLFGLWIQTAGVYIDLTNSIVTGATATAIIDNLIIANGGTTTDNGSNYTGSAGITAAGRTLIIGTLELDLLAPANVILYEKVIALGTKGWTISTVTTICNKSFSITSSSATSVASDLEKTRQMDGIVFGSGAPIDIDLYDTLANANLAGATGRLAQGYALTDAWLRNNTNYNAWVLGTTKAMRFYAADGVSTAFASVVNYKAAPTVGRPCGTVTTIQSFNPSVSSRIGTAYVGADKYLGVALAGNGKLYCAFYDSTRVLEIDPVAGTTTLIGTTYGGGGAYGGIALAGNGKLYCAPFNATQVLEIDPVAGTTTTIGTAYASGGNKWQGIALAGNGKLYCSPYNSTQVLEIDPTSGTTTLIGTAYGAGSKYTGIALAGNGKLYCSPYNGAQQVLEVDPTLGTTALIGTAYGVGGNKWQDIALAGNGKLYCAPFSAAQVLEIDPVAGATALIGTSYATSLKWFGIALASNDKLYCAMWNATQTLEIDPVAGTTALIGTTYAGSAKWQGIAKADSGALFSAPASDTQVLQIG